MRPVFVFVVHFSFNSVCLVSNMFCILLCNVFFKHVFGIYIAFSVFAECSYFVAFRISFAFVFWKRVFVFGCVFGIFLVHFIYIFLNYKIKNSCESSFITTAENIPFKNASTVWSTVVISP